MRSEIDVFLAADGPKVFSKIQRELVRSSEGAVTRVDGFTRGLRRRRLPEPILATAVILFRDGPAGREVFLVRRGADRRFAGGFHAFPGGRLDPDDARCPSSAPTGEEAALVACAARELFEETGVLVARGAERLRLAAGTLRAARRALLDGRARVRRAPRRRRPRARRARSSRRRGAGSRRSTCRSATTRGSSSSRSRRDDAPEVWPGELAGGGLVPASTTRSRAGRTASSSSTRRTCTALRTLARAADRPRTRTSARRPSATTASRGASSSSSGFLQVGAPHPDAPARDAHERVDRPRRRRGRGRRSRRARARRAGGSSSTSSTRSPRRGAARARSGSRTCTPTTSARSRRWSRATASRCARTGSPRAASPATSPSCRVRDGDLLGGRFRVLETPGHAREHLAFLDEETRRARSAATWYRRSRPSSSIRPRATWPSTSGSSSGSARSRRAPSTPRTARRRPTRGAARGLPRPPPRARGARRGGARAEAVRSTRSPPAPTPTRRPRSSRRGAELPRDPGEARAGGTRARAGRHLAVSERSRSRMRLRRSEQGVGGAQVPGEARETEHSREPKYER